MLARIFSLLRTMPGSASSRASSPDVYKRQPMSCAPGRAAAAAHVLARMDVGAALTHQNVAGQHELAVGALYAEALGRGIAAVFGRTLSLIHISAALLAVLLTAVVVCLGNTMNSMGRISAALEGVDPVSYTHLDVYKRQPV